jgi:hypothetical protein
LPELKRKADFSFSLSRPDEVQRLFNIYDIAVLEATLILEKQSRQEYPELHRDPIQAARVLLMFRGGNSRGLAALCDNIDLPFGGLSEAVALDNLYIAQALARIGSPAVRGALLDSLRKPLDRKGLLIRAHVFNQMEPITVMREHLRLALEDQEQREKILAVNVDENYKKNLRLIDTWLSTPGFLRNSDNWPH